MNSPIQTIKLKDGNTLNIFVDEINESPREWDNLTKMIFTGRNWGSLGDKHNVDFSGGFSSREDFITRGAEIVKKHFKDVAIIKPVHLYEHSGATISTSFEYPYNCRWDSGTIGFVIITKSDIRKEYSVKRVTQKELEKAEQVLDAEVRLLDTYLKGEVYRFVIKDTNGNEVDSCGGFYGEDYKTNGMLDYVDGIIDEEVLSN